MIPHLTSPDRDRPPENRDDAPFPYGDASGLALPRPAARGVLRSTDAVGAAGSRACPACGAETVDGAGLFACTDCVWTGRLR